MREFRRLITRSVCLAATLPRATCVSSPGLAKPAAIALSEDMAGALEFIGCDALPELEGVYVCTEEGRDDLEHAYPTYKQVVAGAVIP